MKLQRALANCGPSFPLIQAGLGVYLIFYGGDSKRPLLIGWPRQGLPSGSASLGVNNAGFRAG
jgi:hypothetical protein